MPVGKRIKSGGSYFKGQTLSVSSAPGDYVLVIKPDAGKAFAASGISVIPSVHGDGDTFLLRNMATTAAAGGTENAILIEDVNNIGAGVALNFDFSAIELVDSEGSLRFIYTNTASQAMTVFITTEVVR